MAFITNYFELPVLCYGCGELIDCRKQELLDHLESGLTMQQSLDKMEIFLDCSREAFFNPHVEELDCRNEDIIEGITEISQGNMLPYQKFIYLESRLDLENPITTDKLPTVVGISEINQRTDRHWCKQYTGSDQYVFQTNGRRYYAT